ncbi:MAG: hypothetical protein QUS35_10875 [bacterium]|nr:hypothetical protein [bacterium]
MSVKHALIGFCLAASAAFGRQNGRVDLGTLQTGTTVSFIRDAGTGWGIEISGGGAPRLTQAKPVGIQVLQTEEDIHDISAGYAMVRKSRSGIDAAAEIACGENAVFHVRDSWRLKDGILTLLRKVEVTGTAPGGFNSSITLEADSSVQWSDLECMVPGALYGDPAFNGERSPGGTMNHANRRFLLREDMLPAPLFALRFDGGFSVSVLDPSPRCESTVDETRLVKDVMTDVRFQFGSIGAWQKDGHPVGFGFQFPGTMNLYAFGPGGKERWIRRFHPIEPGVAHGYEVRFRFGRDESFRDLTRNAWRWAWNTLKPAVHPIDVERMRRVLTDHLADQAATIDGRTAIPFAVATFDTASPQWNWTMAAMGFVGKNIECADLLLRESDRDTTGRGRKMRVIGLSIIESMIRALPTVPLQATGYDLATGKPWTGERQEWLAPWLRNATEDMAVLMAAYLRERGLGREHPEWLNWVRQYADWLLLQQREDGSFPRRWKTASDTVAEPTGTASYCPVPMLVRMTEATGDPRYGRSAVRAAEYIWKNFGEKGYYAGGASDNPNITDKEAGMLSLEAFLSLHESTRDAVWLERAKAAADYTETWMWIWNLPMPVDADDSRLHYKKGVPTIGVQGITALNTGSVDEYLDWSAPSYAKLHLYTKDPHYLDVSRVLLHATKSMVALPGRLHGMKGPGWQQEGWRMGPGRSGRGVGGHRFWLPWVSANHLRSIIGLDELDPDLARRVKENEWPPARGIHQ